MFESILARYKLDVTSLVLEPLGTGLINSTWKLTETANGCRAFVLQKVNETVFSNPGHIAENIRQVKKYLAANFPDYFFVAPLETASGAEMVWEEGQGFFRLFPFVADSVTHTVVENPQQAFEAAKQFGQLTRLLAGFDSSKLHATIPSFHNLSLRYRQFLDSIQNGNKERMTGNADIISEMQSYSFLVEKYENVCAGDTFRIRATHHDTKISNVLFNKADKGLCVIDLDTLMPGYFISDVGDMMRTYLSPVSEEEKDFSKIEVRENFYHAIVEGYNSEMGDELTKEENESYFFAGQFMIYMQAIRFFTDYLNNDIYYGRQYEDHNLIRAKNQLTLLKCLTGKKDQLLETAGVEQRSTIGKLSA